MPQGLAKQLFPEASSYGRLYCGDYGAIVSHLGETLVYEALGSYQGDIYAVVKRAEAPCYGLVIIGYGSCSGCDALMGCSTYDEVDDLIDSIVSDVRWFATMADMVAFMEGEEAKLQWWTHSPEYQDGLAAVKVATAKETE